MNDKELVGVYAVAGRGRDFLSGSKDFQRREYWMSSRNIVSVIALGFALAGCGGGLPEVNSTNCSGTGMQSSLTAFDNEAERQAFIDKCQELNAK